MTNDEIKHLMREQWATAILIDADVERIRNIIEVAVLAEREACAKACLNTGIKHPQQTGQEACAAAIRARGEK